MFASSSQVSLTNPEAAEKEEDATAGVMQVEAETDQKQVDATAGVMQVGTETDQKQVEATDENAKEEDDEEEGSPYSSYSSSSSQEKEVDTEKAEEEDAEKELAKLKKKWKEHDQNKRLKKTLDDQKMLCWQSQHDLYRDNFTLRQHTTTVEVVVEDFKAYRNQLRHLYDLKEKGRIEAARKFEERMQKCMRGKEKIMKALVAIGTAEDGGQ